jgi:hypothetical protein
MAENTLHYEYLFPKLIKIVQYKDKDEFKHEGYKASVEHAKEMGVHIYGDKPEGLLRRVRPREDPAITDYRLESYEPTTTSTAGKGLSITNKIFNPKLYAIKPSEGDDGKMLFEYAVEKYPVFNNIVNYLSEYALKKTMADPNGVFLVEPAELPYNESGGIDPTIRIEPVVTCFPSCDVHLITSEYALLFIKEEKDEKGNPMWFYKYVDKMVVDEFYMTSTNQKDYYVVLVSSYTHDCGSLPVWNLGGMYDQRHKKGSILFQSFFYPAVPFWNKAVTAESDLDGAFISHLHPQKWEVADECEYVEQTEHGNYACSGGYIFNEYLGKKWKCGACGGTGRKSVKGPYSTYQVSKDKLTGDVNGSSVPSPPAGYIDIPTKATEMLDERVDKLLDKGLSALAMDIVNKIGENQSGVSKAYDRTELFDFLGKVRDLFYDKHLKNIFYYFAKYMFIGKSDEEIAKIEPLIIKPNDFDIFTTQELTDQLKLAKDANVNPAYQRVKQMEIQNKEFQQHPETLQVLNLTLSLDPYAEISRTDLDLMIYSKTISTETAIVHDNIYDFVRRALEENKGFADMELSKQKEILSGYAEEMMDEIAEETKVTIDQTAIEPDDAGGTFQ